MDKTLLQGLITAYLFMENGDLAGAKRVLTTLPPEYYDDPRRLLMLARVVCLEVQEPEDFAEAITIFRQVARAGSRGCLDTRQRGGAGAQDRIPGRKTCGPRAGDRPSVGPGSGSSSNRRRAKLPVSYLIAARLIINLTLYEAGGAELESLEAEAKAHLGQAETVGAAPRR